MAAEENDRINERLALLPRTTPLRSSLNPLATTFNSYARQTPPTPPSPPLVSTPLQDDGLWAAQQAYAHSHAHAQSPTSSVSSDESVPTLRSFRNSHLWIQFPLSLLICVGIADGMYNWKKEIRAPEFLLGAAASLASEGAKVLVFDLCTFQAVGQDGGYKLGTGLGLPTMIHAVLQEGLRLGAIMLTVALLPFDLPTLEEITNVVVTKRPRTLPPLDILFFSAFWVALGWALCETLLVSRDFWAQMKLYEDVLDHEGPEDEEETLRESEIGHGEVMRRLALEELQERSRDFEREELEAQLGIPLYEIPVAVVVIWRVDSILLSLVLTLLLSLPFRTTSPSLITFQLGPTFAVAASFHLLLSLLWVQGIRHVGIPTVVYVTLILLLAGLFGVLGAWGALA